ncbi:MAG: RdgB/HAM1 family non-canonical purine NTP pyrophosphatase [Sphaerochaetaceae bacterium]|nr:RdgB/HAM1 family non-canonical purine NTP pyrophosphatase [Sphaerochaetaceae bacterium]
MKLYFASGNEHKKQEMKRLLGGFELTLPKEEGISFDPVENGSTFIENALIKARSLYEIVNQPVIADDSGLVCDGLGGNPGIHTARYGCTEEKKLTSQEQYTLLIKNLEGNIVRSARFVCALVLMLSKERIYIIEECVEGSIATTPRGIEGFGYDPVFLVEDTGRTAAELSAEEKDEHSHRGRAARKMNKLLMEVMNEKV